MTSKPVYDWNAGIKDRQKDYQSNYYLTFGAIVVPGARLGLEKAIADELLPVAAQAMGMQPADIDFLLKQLDPSLQQSLASAAIEVPAADKTVLLRRSAGMLVKMFYVRAAFCLCPFFLLLFQLSLHNPAAPRSPRALCVKKVA